MTVQEHSDSRARPLPDRQIEPYDFRRRSTLAREHAKVLAAALETFARQWGTQLTAKVRVMSHVTFDGIELATYDEYASALPDTTVMVLCTIDGCPTSAVVQVPVPAALAWIGHMLGATTPVAAAERVLTPIERALVRRLIDEALEDLRYGMGPLLPEGIDIADIQFSSQFAQAGATTDLMIVSSFTVQVGESSTKATIALPAAAILPQLGGNQAPVPAGPPAVLLRDQLSRVPIDITVAFAPAAVSPSRVLGLAVGDLVHIPHPRHRPLDVRVDGRHLATAAVGASGNRLAVVVVSTEENP